MAILDFVLSYVAGMIFLSARPAEEKVGVVRDMLREKLPPINFAVLQYLILFLARVCVCVCPVVACLYQILPAHCLRRNVG